MNKIIRMRRKMGYKNFAGLISILGISLFPAQLRADSLDTYLEELYRDHIIPGFSVVVVRDDRVVFQKAYGRTYADSQEPMTVHTPVAIGSLTKSFTAMAIMQLVESDLLRLDDPVVKYLPWFRTANKELSDRITIRMLLNNTSGLRAPGVRSSDASENAMENLVRSLASVYLDGEPGTSYAYSNEGFAVAGLLIEKISGLSYSQYLELKLFKSLEMTRTSNDPRDFERIGALYGHYHGVERAIPAHGEDLSLAEFSPAGSLLRSCASDLGSYLIALLNDGFFKGHQIISPESIQSMWTPYSSFPGISVEDGGKGLPFHYGLGWFLAELDSKSYVFHGGNRRNMSSMTFLAPEQRIGAVLLANIDLTLIDRYSYANLIQILNNIIRLSLRESRSGFARPVIADPSLNSYELPEKEQEKYLGEYRLSEGKDWVYLGSRLNIAKTERGLEAEIRKGEQLIERFALDFLSPKTAVSRNFAMARKLQFKFLNEGKVSGLFINDRKYSRLSESYRRKYRQQQSEDKSLQFDFPVSWQISWQESPEGPGFKGSGDPLRGEEIRAQIFSRDADPDSLFLELLPQHQILHLGTDFSEIYGELHWREQALVSSLGGKTYQHLLCLTSKKDKCFVLLLSSEKNLSGTNAIVIPNLLGTFSWKLW